MALKKRDTSHDETLLIIQDDSEVGKYVSESFHIKAQQINQSTYSDSYVTRVRGVKKQTRGLFSYQGEFDYQYQTDENVGPADVIEENQEELLYPDVLPEELGQKISLRERKKIKANLKRVDKVKQSEIEPDVTSFIDW